MSAELQKRADAERAKYKSFEAVPGSGYHDNDRNSVRPEIFLAPQRNGLPKMSESVVHFTDHQDSETAIFVGDDARKVMAALQNYVKSIGNADPVTMSGTDRKLVLKIVPKLKIEAGEGLPRLTVRLCDWNDVLYALQAQKVGLIGLPLEE